MDEEVRELGSLQKATKHNIAIMINENSANEECVIELESKD